ncbi:golgi-body localization protein domain-domain-containing protein [Protomyces lactucae-debilis]|uniref:Golgi-body localization protein domain-domain-containing protein n=1 Tax=Protomyces lactucae-debilis TaxID=2754530 RepID=A0A1Y2FQR4_PROLT|nr:golgi-body localization protein domain-containing protein [Protomyces lactucae-debilis]ORY86330.1 golgi-body localization protein domain-domain-containing protein [Protomyces lactucae-debilis]
MLSSHTAATVVILLVTCAYVLLEYIRHKTGLRIKRFGYFSIRYIDIALPADGELSIGTFGFRPHRPTLAHPTWLTLYVGQVVLTVDKDVLQAGPTKNTGPKREITKQHIQEKALKLRELLNRSILTWVDLHLSEVTVFVRDCGKVQLGEATLALTHRRLHPHFHPGEILPHSAVLQRGIHGDLSASKLLFQRHGKASFEVIDTIQMDFWTLFDGVYSFRDGGISFKVGKVDLVMDELLQFWKEVKPVHKQEHAPQAGLSRQPFGLDVDCLDVLTEVQVHVGYVRCIMTIQDVAPHGKPIALTAKSKDVAFDLNRMTANSPDARMLFMPGMEAHQALISAIATTVTMTTEDQTSEVLSIPMITVAGKTSFLGTLFGDKTASPNMNAVFFNTVITSPASDIHSSQLPVLIGLFRPRPHTSAASAASPWQKSLLPKFRSSLTIHEPTLRVVLDRRCGNDLPPMIIVRFAGLNFDAEGSHHGDIFAFMAHCRLAAGRIYYHSPTNEEVDVLSTEGAVFEVRSQVLPLSAAHISGSVVSLHSELSRTEIIECFAAITQASQVVSLEPDVLAHSKTHKEPQPSLQKVPQWIDSIQVQIERCVISVSGADLQIAPDVRGLSLSLEDCKASYTRPDSTPSKEVLMLGHGRSPSKRRFSATRRAKNVADRRISVTLKGLHLYTIDSEDVMNIVKPIISIPVADLDIALSYNKERLQHNINFRVDSVDLGFSLFKVYATLQALGVLRKAFQSDHTLAKPKHEDVVKSQPVDMLLEARVRLVRLKLDMPGDELQMIDLDHIAVVVQPGQEPAIKLRHARLYTDSHAFPGTWDRVLSIRDISLARQTHTETTSAGVQASKTFVLRTDGVRLRLPHEFVFYQMLEGFINSLKTTTQIVHRFVTRSNDYVIGQHPKPPVKLPRIRVKARTLLVQVEDDPFESRLGMIYRVGLSEQIMRDARETAFDKKVEGLRQQGEHRDFLPQLNKLQEHNSRAWIMRITHALNFRAQHARTAHLAWGDDDVSQGSHRFERVLEIPNRPPLFELMFNNVDIAIAEPSFPLKEYPEFIHKTGKSMPKDTLYSLLIPMSIDWKMDEARVQVRDYPLPLMHVPPLHNRQRIKSRAWEFKTDLVIAEEAPEPESIRHVRVCVVPGDTGRKGSPAFHVDVQRSVSAVKTYAAINIDLNSSLPTRVHWGTSMQAGIADVMRIVDTLSKPQQDLSDKLGFWDKIRLVMHTSLKLNWKQDGDMHITIKGSRDPYVILGKGAGLTKVFRGNVEWFIGCAPDPHVLMAVKCDEYMLAIPDFSKRASGLTERDKGQSNQLHHYHLRRKEIDFQKILMKLTGDVYWTAGMRFERHCRKGECKHCGDESCRIWDFDPHWTVKQVTPEFGKLPDDSVRDAFNGFRSHYIHGQISVTSRQREGATQQSYNTMHLTPKSFSHFFDWIHSFSGNLSLPLRTGSLFPSDEGPKKKFGRFLVTLKYSLKLDPLYISHVYRHSSLDKHGKINTTGIKAKIDEFVLDLHQRKEERVERNKTLETERQASHMNIYRARVDLKRVDLRVVTAEFSADLHSDARAEVLTKDPLDPDDNPRGKAAAKQGDFNVPEEDLAWVDMDDFDELDNMLPTIDPSCQILPLAYAPRFVYDRDTTPQDGNSQDCGTHVTKVQKQRFGYEKSHYCYMVPGENEEQRFMGTDIVQRELAIERYTALRGEISSNKTQRDRISAALDEAPYSHALRQELDNLHDYSDVLRQKLGLFLNRKGQNGQTEVYDLEDTLPDPSDLPHHEDQHRRLKALEGEMESFNNRFVVHDAQLKWNNVLRNNLIRYLQHVNQRRGFSYYMSQKAVKFLMDLVQEQQRKAKEQRAESTEEKSSTHVDDKEELDDEVHKLIQQLLDDKDNFFVSDKTTIDSGMESRAKVIAKGEDITDLNTNYRAHNNYIFLMLGPQVQLQSEKNSESVVVVSMSTIQLRIIAIMDNEVDEEDVSAMLQRKFIAEIHGAQFFHAQKQNFQGAIASVFINNGYGAEAGGYWPPWIPFESLFLGELSAKPFSRIVAQTSATLTYTKHNTLRIKKNERIEKGSNIGSEDADERIDSVAVEFPKFDLTANSTQYYAMFTIVTDLLMYTEPMQKERNDRIEKLLLAADFSDLSGAPEMVTQLQTRIRSLNEFKLQFKLHAQRNDPQSKADEVRVERELVHCEEELFFLMKSVAAAAQQKRDGGNTEVMAAMTWHMTADEILWHLIESSGTPFVDIGLSKATYQRTVNTDSSNFNILEVEMLQGLNLSPKPIFTTLLAPYFSGDKTIIDARRSKMIRIYWYMLEAIGGIPVCDHFEVNLFPLRLQMEHDVGKKLLEYVFPDKSTNDDNASDTDSSTGDSSEDSDEDSVASRSLRPPSDGRLTSKSSRNTLRSCAASTYSRADSRSKKASSTLSLQRTRTNASMQSSAATSADGSSQLAKHKNRKASNDLDAMMSRASTNMSLVYVKVPSAVLSLSYKGPKAKNLVDVTDFVFRFPTIEYRNKTWSYLDLVEHLKREVIKGVLAHTGSLLKDKMTHHRKAKQKPAIQRQLTSYKSFIPGQADERRALEAFERSDSAETSSLAMIQPGMPHKEGGLLSTVLNSNPIGRHIQHLSHLARHKDGIVDDNDESKLKKTRMLLGKFVPKN